MRIARREHADPGVSIRVGGPIRIDEDDPHRRRRSASMKTSRIHEDDPASTKTNRIHEDERSGSGKMGTKRGVNLSHPVRIQSADPVRHPSRSTRRNVMHPSRIIPLSVYAAALLASAVAAQTGLVPAPCSGAGLPADARCGTFEVAENRGEPDGRRLGLYVVVLPARTAVPAREAVIFFAGGPGQASAGELPGGMNEAFGALRDERDLLFIDHRGTGASSPLRCRLRAQDDPQAFLDDYLPPVPVAACRDSLMARADLTRYGHAELADDVDEVRRALGYERLVLWGGSYGTRAAMGYLRAYPSAVRSLVLQAVVPHTFAQPAEYARDMEAALAGLFAECAGDAACGAAFPGVAAELRTVVARLDSAAGEGEILDPVTGRRVRLRLGRGMFAETVRRMMYSPELASMVPFVVHRAWQGDYRPVIRQALADRRAFAEGIFAGLFLAVTCSEDVPRVDTAAAAREDATTVLGAYRVRQQAAACAGWPRAVLPADALAPVRSELPVLLISGELDPVTPSRGAELVAATLPNALHVVVPHAGHGYGGMRGAECVDSLVIRFVRAGTGHGLDTSCLGEMRRPPFVVEMPEAVAVDQAALDRLAGRYVSADPAYAIRFSALEGALRAEGDDFTAVAAPLSPTRFFLDGLPPELVLEFAEDGSTATLRTPRQTLVLTRQP
jgi:pimeloyl-ACP methyl ester carboxylesterase